VTETDGRTARRRSRSWSIRARLFAGYAIALTVACALIAVLIYTGMRYLTNYEFARTTVIVPEGTPHRQTTYSPPVSDGVLDVNSREDVWNAVLMISIGASLVVLAIGLSAGWLLSRRVLAPLQLITEAAERASTGDLASRINADGPQDELRRLADTFDTTMARLERSFDSHRRFAANASHELRTPLSATRALLQLIEAADPQTRAEIVTMLNETNERNIRLVEQLLLLARADHLTARMAESVDLAEVTRACVAEIDDAARAAGLTLQIETNPDTIIGADTVLVRQVVRNLLENAMAYNVTDGWLRIRVGRFVDPESVTLDIENTGAPMKPELAARLTEPFFRTETRTHHGDHHGLGLALVTSVVEAFDGRLEIAPRASGGLRVTISFPHSPRTRRR
jgi:two-component system sensor histidine kinase VanS